MQILTPKRKFSPEEKQQLIANLDIEVEHRTRQLESWLADALENFRIHHEGHPSRIPRTVLGVKMRDLEEKYQGDVQVCLRAMQMDKLVGTGAGVERSTRKRKWLAEHEEGERSGRQGPDEAESSRGIKNARVTATPKKTLAPAASQVSVPRVRIVAKSPGSKRTIYRPPSRAPSPSPMKAFRFGGSARPTSPVKPSTVTPHARRPPSTATFNPALPKTPAYPQQSARLPRKNESMLSMNGSPLTNPYEFGVGWLPDVAEEGVGGSSESSKETEKGKGKMKRTDSIVIRRDPSFAVSTSKPSSSGIHSRTNSQTTLVSSGHHSRTHSQTSNLSQPSIAIDNHKTPIPQRLPAAGQVQVSVPTKDGFYLQFNPLMVSPGALDELEGITDSAKKQAKEDLAHLVQEAVNKWSVA